MSLPPNGPGPGGRAAVGYADVAAQLADGVDDTWVRHALTAVERRDDLADHKLLTLLALLLDGGTFLPSAMGERIRDAALGFRYWYDEPGQDSMCHWSESHQAVFAVCEYLAGTTWAELEFTNDHRTGAQKADRARVRLMEWLGNRFRHGFSEWLSGTFLSLSASALVLLVDHAGDDEELAIRASMVLDLILLDLAMHRFDGHLAGSAGRVRALYKVHPERGEAERIMASAFGRTPLPFQPAEATSIFQTRRRYRVPQVVREIAHAQGEHLVTASHGLDLQELPMEVARRGLTEADAREATLNLLWGMEAFATPEGIGPSLAAVRRHGLDRNHFLSPLASVKLRSPRIAAALVRSLNPVTRGAALTRADVQTYRTPHYLLSSVQRHRPGDFGDQENVWEAALPGGIHVFSTHPGSSMFDETVRPQTPSAWEGNGIRPDAAQLRNRLLVVHDVRGRHGHLEGRRHELSHLYFPAARFDETFVSGRVVAGRRDDSYFAALALERVEMVSETEVVQRGQVTAWAVLLTDRSDHGSLSRLVAHLRNCSLQHSRGLTTWATPDGTLTLRQRGSFQADGIEVETAYPRLRSPWSTVGRKPSVVEISGRTGSLVLDWKLGQRHEGPAR